MKQPTGEGRTEQPRLPGGEDNTNNRGWEGGDGTKDQPRKGRSEDRQNEQPGEGEEDGTNDRGGMTERTTSQRRGEGRNKRHGRG